MIWKVAKLFAQSKILATFAVELFDSKTLKIARFPTRYCYFSNISLKVYSSNGYIKPL